MTSSSRMVWVILAAILLRIAGDVSFLLASTAASFIFVVWGNSRSDWLSSWCMSHSQTWITRVVVPAVEGSVFIVVSALRPWSGLSGAVVVSVVLDAQCYLSWSFIAFVSRPYLVGAVGTVFFTQWGVYVWHLRLIDWLIWVVLTWRHRYCWCTLWVWNVQI